MGWVVILSLLHIEPDIDHLKLVAFEGSGVRDLYWAPNRSRGDSKHPNEVI